MLQEHVLSVANHAAVFEGDSRCPRRGYDIGEGMLHVDYPSFKDTEEGDVQRLRVASCELQASMLLLTVD